MRIRDLILPEDRVFFTLFAKMAGVILESSDHLVTMTGDLSRAEELTREIRRLEHEGDGITRQVYERLNQSLITPLEPDEITRLAPALDDILDRIDWVAHQIANYEISSQDEVLREFTAMIRESAGIIQKSVVSLANFEGLREVQEMSYLLNQIWNNGIELLSRSVRDLFRSSDPLLVIKLKDIYENMQKVLEKCNDFGHVVNDIAISHT